MKLYLTGEPCTQQRHCYFVEGESASFIMDCGYQRCYRGDELPHLLPDQIRAARYLFLSHSHENQSGALPYLLSNGFTGRVVLTTETARQLPLGIDDPIVLEGLSVPYAEAPLPGGISLTWGRSGHCSGSVWFRMAENGRSLFFSGDYYDCARVHARDPIEGISANLAVLDCDYGMQPGAASRDAQVEALIEAISAALADGRPVILPVPRYGRGLGILTYICERLPETDIFADRHFMTELGHMDATAMWVRPQVQDMLAGKFIRAIPEDFVALGVYFVCDPQLDDIWTRKLIRRLLICGGRVIFTGTVEPNTLYGIVVDKAAQTLTVYKNGERLGSCAVSTGLATAKYLHRETPAGEYITVTRRGTIENAGGYSKYTIRISGNYYLCEIPTTKKNGKDFSIMEDALGSKASRGNICLAHDASTDGGINAEWIWNITEENKKIKVLVFDDKDRSLVPAGSK